MENFVINKNGVVLEEGNTYYYYNIGLGEIKDHTILYFSDANQNAVSYNGKVDIDSLYYTHDQCCCENSEVYYEWIKI